VSLECQCERCNGFGTIDCPDCDGLGELGLEAITLPESDPRHAELERLKEDAERVEDAERRLSAMKPEHEASYRRQAEATLRVIEAEIEDLLKQREGAA